ncbi:MAG: YicC family protein [Clostridiales bacterium]|nr:YicC family protein [Clostridiales bacterium]
MIMSMTGYGSGQAKDNEREITIEIKTLNHRYLDPHIRLPKNIAFIEQEMRNIIKERLYRGRVDVYIEYVNFDDSMYRVELNRPLLKNYMRKFDILKNDFNIENDITATALLAIPDMFILHRNAEDEELIMELARYAMDKAISSVRSMRAKEGKKLKEDILKRAYYIREMVDGLRLKTAVVVEEYKERLKLRLEEIIPAGSELDINRLNMEVVYFADRSNITEEIIRLDSHIDQLEDTLNMDGSIGRKLDFLMQEMGRESNTIGAKSSDTEITSIVVELKSEIEKIREQVQNIE